jgi:histidine ammonia-lyase
MELPEHLSLQHLSGPLPDSISIAPTLRERTAQNRSYLEQKIQQGGTHYGINTGFGSLCQVRIADEELALLQENLVCSHACGMGEVVPEEIVRLMLLLKVQGLAQGYSGVRTELIDFLIRMYNEHIHPVVYELGSLGASGDLAPLAHLSLPILGKGEVWQDGKKRPAAEVLKEKGISSMSLSAKEGLALLNGTQFMNSHGVWALRTAERLMNWAAAISALSLEAFDAKSDPFHSAIQRLRPHPGQIKIAEQMRAWLKGSEIQSLPKAQVQDPYSFRCIPQVHGATDDVIRMARTVIETEMASVTDNPLVVDDEDVILSGGNFHGQPLALQLDFLAIALAEIANISERRIYLLVSGQRGLPPFLAPDAGLNSGFMIAQYTAAAIVSQNKGLCTPASVDSIVSSNGQEDHVSMGANAATKLRRVLENVQRVLGIELLTAAQAFEMRRPLKSSAQIEKLYAEFRAEVSFMDKDRVLHDDLVAAERFLDLEAPKP